MASSRVTQGKKLSLWGRIKRLALTDVGALVRGFKAADIEAIERTLLEADFGVSATTDLVDLLEVEVRKGRLKSEDDLKRAIVDRVADMLKAPSDPATLARPASGPTVLLVMGVNGTGKTTTVAKLAARYRRQGDSVLLVAADTYRAGAIDQLKTWADRIGVPCVSGASGGDPAAVAFDGLEAATARGASLVIIDTAGRLHTQEGLMDELRKVGRVIGRKIPGAPHESFLVLDGTVGQNAIQQARLFTQAIAPTGLVITKLDGTARGGAVVALRRELAVPVRFIGLGEGLEDLAPFDPRRFAEELVEAGAEE
ncbi:MAG: signal recognition particle-docking protein FtsY [Gemmatimonadales bacterium]|nr:signal recognition particle-docking protein FtsY [Gemmatimonadota bacterium]MDX2057493.1 signal recognition particle-docking protein FtsY [Gemmatimonadales bacterium]